MRLPYFFLFYFFYSFRPPLQHVCCPRMLGSHKENFGFTSEVLNPLKCAGQLNDSVTHRSWVRMKWFQIFILISIMILNHNPDHHFSLTNPYWEFTNCFKHNHKNPFIQITINPTLVQRCDQTKYYSLYRGLCSHPTRIVDNPKQKTDKGSACPGSPINLLYAPGMTSS